MSADSAKARLLDKFMKKIRVRSVMLSGFDPGLAAFGREDLDKVVAAFRAFLVKEMDSGGGETVLLKVEK